jgi:hypothetical protein
MNLSLEEELKKCSHSFYSLLNKRYFDNNLPELKEIIWRDKLEEDCFAIVSFAKDQLEEFGYEDGVVIEMSVEANSKSYKEIRDTFLHEMAHVYVKSKYHGRIWTQKIIELGLDWKNEI